MISANFSWRPAPKLFFPDCIVPVPSKHNHVNRPYGPRELLMLAASPDSADWVADYAGSRLRQEALSEKHRTMGSALVALCQQQRKWLGFFG
jgi:hypothetical protein